MSILAPHGTSEQRAEAFVEAGFGPCVSGSVPCRYATGLQHGKLVCTLSGKAQFVTTAGARLCPMSAPASDSATPPPTSTARRDQSYLVR